MVDTEFKKTANETIAQSSSWSRVVIEGLTPEVDGGRYPAKRVQAEKVIVRAHVHVDGHNALACILLSRKKGEQKWHQSAMQLKEVGFDTWEGSLRVAELGYYEFTVHAWIDQFANWSRDTGKKQSANQSIEVEIEEGVTLIQTAAKQADELSSKTLTQFAKDLHSASGEEAIAIANNPQLQSLMFKYAPRGRVCEYGKILPLVVEPIKALYSSWYEFFPRSVATDKTRKHGTFKDAINHLPYVSEMGFDVVYLPPIHPIGQAHRKGKNNSLKAEKSDVGSPWAIGAKEGGHTAVHPELGTLTDFDALVGAAREQNIEIAMDIAYQCSPDHPYVKEHPEWFYHRPDGGIRYAENPPKKYEDIYPINFECDDWQALWRELTDVILFWVQHGVKIFRVDNPHTKPFAFWEYMIAEVKSLHPETIFLAEAFARPKIMYHLAKAGFSQSYSYFTWRNSKHEITNYFSEAYAPPVVEYFRPNLFANTPDIFPEFLQFSGRPGYLIRLVLAATLGASYGIYGPVFELCSTEAIPGSEEYKDSEKYEIREWDLNQPGSIKEFIARVNKIRRQNPALHQNRDFKFLRIDNDEVIAYSKTSSDGTNTVVTVVNLNPNYAQGGNLFLSSKDFGTDDSYQVHDLITGMRFLWSGESNFVKLEPHVSPAFVFRILKRVRTEQDFDYFV